MRRLFGFTFLFLNFSQNHVIVHLIITCENLHLTKFCFKSNMSVVVCIENLICDLHVQGLTVQGSLSEQLGSLYLCCLRKDALGGSDQITALLHLYLLCCLRKDALGGSDQITVLLHHFVVFDCATSCFWFRFRGLTASKSFFLAHRLPSAHGF